MKTIKRLIASICACAFLLTGTISTLTVSATSSDIEPVYVANDAIWQSAAESDAELINAPMTRSEFPASVDNSATEYFPTIGNQGAMGSCAGWATTYYQYTYEVNKYKNISTNVDNVYSPSWTYNYINGGANRGTYLNDAYNVLTNQGAMKLCDYSYSTSPDTYSYSWSTNVQKMTDALKYRVNRYYINCSSSYDLYNAKYNLSNGKVGVIWTDAYGWTMEETNTGEKIIVRGSSGGGGHFMAVVGYDDTITTTFNGVTMTGAFKLANSWGTNWLDGNNGYIWVAYDALNSSSIYGESWQSNLSSTRQQIFGYNNEMNFVNIEHYNTYYVGKVTYISNDPWHNNIFGDISTTASTRKFKPSTGSGSTSNLQNPEYRVIVFDYFNNPNLDVANYINSSFTTKMTNYTTNTTYRVYFTLMDNLGKTILPNDTIAGSYTNGEYSRTFNLNLAKGKIASYTSGNVTSADVSLLSSYLLGERTLSSLQGYLADMNDDGNVNVFDLVLMRSAATNSTLNEDIMSAYIPELGTTIEEFILNEYGVEVLEQAESILE